MRRRVARINEAVRGTSIGLAGVEGPIATVGDARVNLGRDQLHRVFNHSSFGLGGRMYGAFWQNLPKLVRRDLVIDGKPTSEGDYAQLHPRLLYAEAGARLEGDAYGLDGWPRPLVKCAFNIAINADTEQAAVLAIAQEIGGKGAHTKARALLEAIEARHRPIARFFGSGAGLRLQRRDADLAERVNLGLLDRGIAVLSVHDSFVVQTRHGPVRDGVMDDELGKLLAELAATARTVVPSDTYAESGPQNGGGDVGGGGAAAPALHALFAVTASGVLSTSAPASSAPPPLLVLVSERAFLADGPAPSEAPAADDPI